jgi:hypothetical protein
MQPALVSLPSRLLGEDYAAPRPVYFTHIPAILMLTGLGAWIASNELAMVLAATVASLVAGYLLWDWLVREGPTRFSTIYAMTILLGYGLGALNTWFTLPRGGLSLSAFMGADEGVLARGMAAVLLSASFLCFLGELYERPLFGREFRIPLDQRTYTLIYVGTLAIIAGYFAHALDFGGGTSSGGQQSVASALLGWVFAPLVALTAGVFLATPKGLPKLFTGICTLVLCALVMTVGRRVVIYTAMEILFALRLTGYRLKGTAFKKILLFAGVAGFVVVGVTVVMLLKLAANQSRLGMSTPLIQRVQIALSWVEDGTALTRATEANRTNARTRTFVLGFLADIVEGSSRSTPALGRDFMWQTYLALPRVVATEKDSGIGEEALVDEIFGLTYRDAANSILTNGATDFGLLGVIVYPLFFVWLLRFSIDVLSRFLPPSAASLIALGAIFEFLQTEAVTTGYIVTLRDEILFTIILMIFFRLPIIRLRN